MASLGRPGGNITGVSALTRELSGKRLELLKDLVPGLARVAVVWNPVEVSAVRQLRDTEDAARVLGPCRPASRTSRPYGPPTASRSGSTTELWSLPPRRPAACRAAGAGGRCRRYPSPATSCLARAPTASGARPARGLEAERGRRCCCAKTGATPAGGGADTANGRTSRAPPVPGPSKPVGAPGAPGAAGATTPGVRHVWPWPPGPSRAPGGPNPARPR